MGSRLSRCERKRSRSRCSLRRRGGVGHRGGGLRERGRGRLGWGLAAGNLATEHEVVEVYVDELVKVQNLLFTARQSFGIFTLLCHLSLGDYVIDEHDFNEATN